MEFGIVGTIHQNLPRFSQIIVSYMQSLTGASVERQLQVVVTEVSVQFLCSSKSTRE